jgi:HTH-type transcriptional regulator/antitoxin HipB
MSQTVRTPKQFGAAIRRQRKLNGLSQTELGDRVLKRQATISTLEDGDTGTKLGTLFDVLAALNLEIVIQSRDTPNQPDIEDIF